MVGNSCRRLRPAHLNAVGRQDVDVINAPTWMNPAGAFPRPRSSPKFPTKWFGGGGGSRTRGSPKCQPADGARLFVRSGWKLVVLLSTCCPLECPGVLPSLGDIVETESPTLPSRHRPSKGWPTSAATTMGIGPAELLSPSPRSSRCPTGRPYRRILAAKFVDAWGMWPARPPGFNCCEVAPLSNPTSTTTERIDVVFSRGTPGERTRQHPGQRAGGPDVSGPSLAVGPRGAGGHAHHRVNPWWCLRSPEGPRCGRMPLPGG
jgi:hypothetical protein